MSMTKSQMARLRREVDRVLRKIGDAVEVPLARRRRKQLDQAFPGHLHCHPGSLPPSEKCAVVVLYQPKGVAASAHDMLRHLAEKGYMPLVVSNAPLRDEDLAALKPLAQEVVERPNIGHDFGAYRDGLKLLAHRGQSPDRVILINDSIWFPMQPADDLIDRLETACDGIIGPIFDCKPGREHNAHFQSHFLMFDRAALEHPAFRAYWADYPMPTRRSAVLKLGEKGLSQALLRAGFGRNRLATRTGFQEQVATLDAHGLATTLAYSAMIDPAKAAATRTLLAARDRIEFTASARAFVADALGRDSFTELFPYLTQVSTGTPLMKKRISPQSWAARRKFLALIDDATVPAPHPGILSEIRAGTPKVVLPVPTAQGPGTPARQAGLGQSAVRESLASRSAQA
jgi:hypothetical protein